MSLAAATRRTSIRGGNGRGSRAVVMPLSLSRQKPLAAARPASHQLVVDDVTARIPGWVVDHESFRRWCHSPEFPEEGRVTFVDGEVIFDLSREQIYSHVRMKTVLAAALHDLTRRQQSGVFFGDGLLISNLPAEVSNNPDGTFVSAESFKSKTVRHIEGAAEGFVELEGSPDMVLEVVSDSSVKKDYELLREAYWKAGIREYWLVDARGGRLEFQILKHTRRGYSPTRKVGGWLKSAVFDQAFQLVATENPFGQADYELKVR